MADLTVTRRNDKTYTINFADSDGNAINITGWKIYFTVKKVATDADNAALIQKSVTSHTNAAGGISAVTLTNSNTNLPEGRYAYDIKVIKNDGTNETITSGGFNIVEDITDATS